MPQIKPEQNIKIFLKTSFIRGSSDETKRNTKTRLKKHQARWKALLARDWVWHNTDHSGSLATIKGVRERHWNASMPNRSCLLICKGKRSPHQYHAAWKDNQLWHETPVILKSHGHHLPHLERLWCQAHPKAQYILQQLTWELSRQLLNGIRPNLESITFCQNMISYCNSKT